MNFMPLKKYEVDVTGSNPDNRVMEERHQVSPTYNIIIPVHAPFFQESLVVTYNGKRLVPNTDYQFDDLDVTATQKSNKSVYTTIVLKRQDIQGEIWLNYQTYGDGNYAGVVAKYIELIMKDNRKINWSEIFNKPSAYPPTYHEHHVKDIRGIWPIVLELQAIKQAIEYLRYKGNTKLKKEIFELITNLNDKFDRYRDVVEKSLDLTEMKAAIRDAAQETVDGAFDNIKTKFAQISTEFEELKKQHGFELNQQSLTQIFNGLNSQIDQLVSQRLNAHQVPWSKVTGKPDFSLSWENITNKPDLFDGEWNSLKNKPTTFATRWDMIGAKPTTFPTTWDDVADKPKSYPSDWNSLRNIPFYLPSSWKKKPHDITTSPTVYGYYNIGGTAIGSRTGGAYLYNQLREAPSEIDRSGEQVILHEIPGEDSLAVERLTDANKGLVWVRPKRGIGKNSNAWIPQKIDWENILNKPSSFGTGGTEGTGDVSISRIPELKERYNFATTLDTEPGKRTGQYVLSLKPLFPVSTTNPAISLSINKETGQLSWYDRGPNGETGSLKTHWNDIIDKPSYLPTHWTSIQGKPNLFSGSYTDLTNKPTSFPTNWSDIRNVPNSFPVNWNDVQNKPDLSQLKNYTIDVPNVALQGVSVSTERNSSVSFVMSGNTSSGEKNVRFILSKNKGITGVRATGLGNGRVAEDYPIRVDWEHVLNPPKWIKREGVEGENILGKPTIGENGNEIKVVRFLLSKTGHPDFSVDAILGLTNLKLGKTFFSVSFTEDVRNGIARDEITENELATSKAFGRKIIDDCRTIDNRFLIEFFSIIGEIYQSDIRRFRDGFRGKHLWELYIEREVIEVGERSIALFNLTYNGTDINYINLKFIGYGIKGKSTFRSIGDHGLVDRVKVNVHEIEKTISKLPVPDSFGYELAGNGSYDVAYNNVKLSEILPDPDKKESVVVKLVAADLNEAENAIKGFIFRDVCIPTLIVGGGGNKRNWCWVRITISNVPRKEYTYEVISNDNFYDEGRRYYGKFVYVPNKPTTNVNNKLVKCVSYSSGQQFSHYSVAVDSIAKSNVDVLGLNTKLNINMYEPRSETGMRPRL